MKKQNIANESIIDIIEDEIMSIELIGEKETIDITVEDAHMFFANDIYTHNSALNKDKFGLETISESLGKAQTADIILGIGRPDEDKIAKKATMMVLKNRNGEDGYSLRMTFDTSKIDIQIDDDGAGVKMGVKGLHIEAQIRAQNQ